MTIPFAAAASWSALGGTPVCFIEAWAWIFNFDLECKKDIIKDMVVLAE